MEASSKNVFENKKVAKIGDKVIFTRQGYSIVGKVTIVKEESVIVYISNMDAKRLKIDTPVTVVAHKNYKVLS
ncbi:MAG TPA: DUF2187 family protein [Bacillaceae bacterium]|uniref:DUF2187 family protein n=1 Tax=Lederbergia graminis TaxID=735518 RepID=A0ABW0LJD3_9BACI|nr:DUF2187 family protein [Paenibacillus bovis]HLU23098.1 DUF2187 family protein [Bacillaceae bacterium]